MDFTNKTAISTGAASGMGLLFAQNFANLGGNVVMCDVNGETLGAAVAKINEIRGGAAIGVVCDVRKYDEIVHARDEAVRVFGRCPCGADLFRYPKAFSRRPFPKDTPHGRRCHLRSP